MKKKTRLTICLFLCVILSCMMLSGCGLRPFFRYNSLQMKYYISMIITDRFTDLEKVDHEAGTDFFEGGENVWEVTLPDRGGIRVRFYNGIDDFAGNGMGAHDWHRYIKTDYVGQVILAADQAGKNKIDERYGMLPDTTEVDFDKYGTVKVYVHTKRGIEDFSGDDLVSYIGECLDYYDLGIQPAGTYKEGAYYGVEQLTFVIVYDELIDASTGKPFEDDLIPVQGTLSDYQLLGDGKAFQEDFIRAKHSEHIAQYKHKNGLEDKLSDEQGMTAIRNYCMSANPELEEIVATGEYPVFWDIEASTEYEIVVLFRSYTGAEIRYYIDRVSGNTHVTEFVPGITDAEERTEEEFNVRDHLE
ncbi:MAG: hypothetical protein K6E16_08035 [Lachnospiraceae bacterium]|nr:hypothetical protein [Lachnospiraceae bacterium]